LAYFHSKKIAQKGIKPDNVFFEEVDSLNVRLMNFRNSIKMGKIEKLSGINENIDHVAPLKCFLEIMMKYVIFGVWK